jgi:PKD repeat protein
MSKNHQFRRSLSPRLLAALLGTGVLLTALSAQATNQIYGTWVDTYPDSLTDDNAGCLVCHNTPSGTGGFNPYGADVFIDGIAGAEGLDSDGDPGGCTNIQEITLSTQPAWTPSNPPAYTISGDLDPDPSLCGEPNLVPTADPNGPYAGLVGEPIDFDGTASEDPDGTIVSYDWNFGDGASGIGPTPTHSYDTAATYDVSLTVTDNDGATNTAFTLAVIDDLPPLLPPVADAGGPYDGNPDEPLTLNAGGSSDPDGSIETYTWDFGDGTPEQTVTTAIIQHTYDLSDSYTAILTVTDNDGLTDSDTAQVNIGEGDPPPVADAGGPYTGEPGVPVTLDGSGSSDSGSGTIESYAWEFGDGGSGVGEVVDHTYAAEGIFNVTLTVTDNGGKVDSDSTTATITGLTPPVADPNGPYNGLIGEDIQFDGTGSDDPDGAVVAWNWDFGDGSTGSGATPVHAYSAVDTYTVTLVVTDDDGLTSVPAVTTADITDVFVAPIADPNGPYAGTEARELTFDGTGSYDPDGGNIVGYAWDFGDGNTGIGSNPTNIYDLPGTYTVSLVVTDDEGASSAAAETTAEIGVDAPPVADPNGPYSGTVNLPVSFDGSASSDDFAIVDYAWDFGDGSTGSGVAPEHSYAATGEYTVSLNVTDDAGQMDTAATTATIGDGNLPPVADAGGPYVADVEEAITFDGTGSTDPNGDETIDSYDWDFGDGTVMQDAGPTPTHAYTEPGLYHVTLTVTDDFGAMDSDKTEATIGDSQPGDEADVFLLYMAYPKDVTLRETRTLDRIIRVFGDGNEVQEARVNLHVDAPPGVKVELSPSGTITNTVEPGRPATEFFFDASIQCKAQAVYEIHWTATIDAVENSDSTGRPDTLEGVTRLSCIYSVPTREPDVFLLYLGQPAEIVMADEEVIDRTIRVFGDGSVIEQQATVSLQVDAPEGVTVNVSPPSMMITNTVEPGRPATEFFFDASFECTAKAVYEIYWTATIDAAENSDSTDRPDTLEGMTELTCIYGLPDE